MLVHRSSLLNLVLAENPDHSADAVLGHRKVILPWEKWGMKMTRIFNVTHESPAWITMTAGQRCAVDLTWPSRDDDERKQKVTVLDFNPRAAQRLCKESMVTDDPSVMVHLEENVIEHEMFEEPVKTSLPYVSRVLSLKNDSNVPFEGVLLDEERLLGIKVRFSIRHVRVSVYKRLQLNDEHLITEIEVMHFGSLNHAQRSESSQVFP
ncbi:hypothetical protein C0992_002705 [Termitomyces sp. T32_za158]|nr:hypothetical protein C0992_002705 [Termitomyces sp. T32_za158]